ncbi:MAG: thiamine phosphate synthase [Candidatus Dormibacteria bacterium]
MTPLPPLLVLTDRRACERRGRTLAETVAEAVSGGARAFVLREKDLPAGERLRQAEAVGAVLRPAGGILIVSSDPALAERLGSGWVHLAAADPRPTASPRLRTGRSCHDAASLARAREEGSAYATLSPVLPSRSKPGYGPALGLARLAELVAGVPALPVYALGGIDATSAAGCHAAGAAGVAVMGAVMGAKEPAAAARALARALDPGRADLAR